MAALTHHWSKTRSSPRADRRREGPGRARSARHRTSRPSRPALFGVLLLSAAATLGSWPRHAEAAAGQTAATGGAAGGARTLYLSDCAVCHGSEGRGTNRGPSLVGVGRASVDYQLTTGRMPVAPVGRAPEPGDPLQPLPNRGLGDPAAPVKRHRAAYSSEDIAGLVDYVDQVTGGGGPGIPVVAGGDVAEGGSLFRFQCAACHAWAGDGGALLHVDAPSLHASTPTQIAEAVRLGPGQMPAFGDAALTDEQVASVVTYVRHLNHARDAGGRPLWHLGPVAEGGLALIALAGLMVFLRWIGERG
ncbi:MAG: ubiquinol-cytochrome c reductase cytochrome c subunit [Actinomycetota bacterium]|nr:ubiquinol-cytochrome c reductase cytochrome c subunit [Actinomycetota bacterium]